MPSSSPVLPIPCAPALHGVDAPPPPTRTLLVSAGRYGSVPGLAVATCSGPCQAGYYCPAGSFSPTSVTCPSGAYCPAASANYTLCDPGQYSPAGSDMCLACAAGFYGSTSGMTVPTCTGDCSAGYACPAGSTSSTSSSNVCPPGQYSAPGAASCSNCRWVHASAYCRWYRCRPRYPCGAEWVLREVCVLDAAMLTVMCL